MLKSITVWFNYIFYRSSLTYRYFKDDSSLSPTLVVVVIKGMFAVDLIVLIQKTFASQEFIDRTSSATISIITVGALLILYLDYNRFDGKFEQLHEKWKNESRTERVLKGFLVFITFIVPWVPFIVSSLR
jgi:arginine exporter protein ArgO